MQNRLLQLSRGWVVDPDTNIDRQRRIAAAEKVLDWLASIWMIRLQIATSLLIVGMGVVLTVRAISELAALPAG